MLYNSFPFLFVFLPACLGAYFLAARVSGRLANVTLLAFSLLFYGWDGPGDLAVIVASMAFNFAVGARLQSRSTRPLLASAIIANLAVLAFFKYAPAAGVPVRLPPGISFYTFTQIAFLIDAARGRANDLDASRYALFVTFFPHLLAGPIVHHAELMPQFAGTPRRWLSPNAHVALAFITLGLFKKVWLADPLAPWAAAAFDAPHAIATADAWRGALAYALQLYFDFSGYSDMAIGLALLFNVRLPDNFDSPYKSAGVVEFWRRWHVTLGRFLRDYVYIPLGGNRRGRGRERLNLLLTMTLAGAWHGAGWTFVAWGAYHGLLLTAEHAWSARRWRRLPRSVARPLTFVLVLVGWVLFRSPNLITAASRLASMAGGAGRRVGVAGGNWLALSGLLVFVAFAPNTKQWIERRPLSLWRAALLGVLFFLCLLRMRSVGLAGGPRPFVYFRF